MKGLAKVLPREAIEALLAYAGSTGLRSTRSRALNVVTGHDVVFGSSTEDENPPSISSADRKDPTCAPQ